MEHSPVVSEVNHLTAGLSHLYLRRFDLFRVNPPLIRIVAALPAYFTSPATDWHRYDTSPLARSDWDVSHDFLKVNGIRALWFFTVGRWACIPFSVLGGYICCRWATELYGAPSGGLALVLWCFCPFIIGHASLFTPDAHSAAIGVTAYYAFWRWLNRPEVPETVLAGLLLGLAAVTKFTLLVFYPLWLVTWLIYKLTARNPQRCLFEGGLLLTIFCSSIIIINLLYGFESSFRPIGEFQFQSRLLTVDEPDPKQLRRVRNRFRDTWLASLPMPFPANYLQGIDTQRLDFERKKWSYLRGEWRFGGWSYYYIYALAIKLPLGTLCLLLMSAASCISRRYQSTLRNEFVLLSPSLAILILVSSQTGFSIHTRYLLPILPFTYLWCSKIARALRAKNTFTVAGGTVAICWSVGSSLWYYPHSISYFNEFVGGPMGGHHHLLDSNIAWGQDLTFLKRWYEDNPAARPFHVACYGLLDSRLAGIDFSLPPVGPSAIGLPADKPFEETGPLPGWFAVDVNHLHGARLTASDGHGRWESLATDNGDLTYFQNFLPVGMAGYSIYIYHISSEEANRIRHKLGLPNLTMTERNVRGANQIAIRN